MTYMLRMGACRATTWLHAFQLIGCMPGYGMVYDGFMKDTLVPECLLPIDQRNRYEDIMHNNPTNMQTMHEK